MLALDKSYFEQNLELHPTLKAFWEAYFGVFKNNFSENLQSAANHVDGITILEGCINIPVQFFIPVS
jgi:hypothetical protein